MAFPHDGKKWTSGQSGNPKGRPVGAKGRSTVIKRWLEAIDKGKNPITGAVEEMSVEDRITVALIAKALKGDTQAYKALMDSAYGQPKQEVQQETTQEVYATIQWYDTNDQAEPEVRKTE
tara:strand:- start:462 stop:821 length:360 start_codon:yes stop_codon:yes gene_type:complete